MESLLDPLLPLFERERTAGRAVALGVLIATAGSTYRKPGALMLIAADGDFAGLLSGGCLESDLREHAQNVIDTGRPHLVRYDTRGPEDLIWGLGLGCEGAMDILLLRVGPPEKWQPMAHFMARRAQLQPTSIGIVTESARADVPVGALLGCQDAGADSSGFAAPRGAAEPGLDAILAASARSGRAAWYDSSSPGWRAFVLPVGLPPRILLLGAGPDALPVTEFAARLGWIVTVFDHRAAYANPAHFPAAEQVLLARPEQLLNTIQPERYVAAIVMSHHLPSDLEYLRALAETGIPYVGLLGPAQRRERLLTDLGPLSGRVRGRLHAPIGLPLGGRSPESVALSIVAEIQAFLHDTDPGTASNENDTSRSKSARRVSSA